MTMKLLVTGSAILAGVLALGVLSAAQAQSGSFTGTVERVWEDGLRLNTGDRSLQVDTWDIYGDSTASYISVGDQITITGEFDNGEFDAFSITDNTGAPLTVPASPAVAQAPGTSFTGTVEQVWEDGLRLNTGDRSLRVDTWDLCGDFTANSVAVGDRLTVTGEFDGGEFDAFSMTNSDGVAVCR
jgi:hypothetical protein